VREPAIPKPVLPEREDVTLAEARELILSAIRPIGGETVSLGDAVGRVLLEEIEADRAIPPQDNSAMDGFAVRSADVAGTPAVLRVVEELPAGRSSSRPIGRGEAARIMTGAAIPEGSDCVIRVEDTEAEGERVRVLEPGEPGLNVRAAGCDVRPGTPIAAAGSLLGPPQIGMLAALGRTVVRVAARARVAILATGDELVEPDRLREDGRIATSNSYALLAAVQEAGAVPVYLGIAPDRPAEIAERLREAARCDAVVSTGGVSVGEHDHIKRVLSSLGGEMRLWRVRMRPGAPLAFVMLGGRPIFGLPGNPVSSLVTFEQFVRPALLKMMGHTRIFRPVAQAVLVEGFEKPRGRMYLVRVTLEERDGELFARLTGEQSSAVLLSMVRADALAMIPADSSGVPAGGRVAVQLLRRSDLREEPGF
jgi:molybdopterin molybdotransferase